MKCNIYPGRLPWERKESCNGLIALLAVGIVFFAGALTTLAIVALIVIAK